jgi:hypothetical protein
MVACNRTHKDEDRYDDHSQGASHDFLLFDAIDGQHSLTIFTLYDAPLDCPGSGPVRVENGCHEAFGTTKIRRVWGRRKEGRSIMSRGFWCIPPFGLKPRRGLSRASVPYGLVGSPDPLSPTGPFLTAMFFRLVLRHLMPWIREDVHCLKERRHALGKTL